MLFLLLLFCWRHPTLIPAEPTTRSKKFCTGPKPRWSTQASPKFPVPGFKFEGGGVDVKSSKDSKWIRMDPTSKCRGSKPLVRWGGWEKLWCLRVHGEAGERVLTNNPAWYTTCCEATICCEILIAAACLVHLSTGK